MDTIILNHKTYGTVYADAADYHNTEAFMPVTLKTPHHMPRKGIVRSLSVGKSAIKEGSGGYVPKHREKTLCERFLPLANGIAAKMRSGNDDYDELCCVAYVGLAKAADGYDADVGSFQAYATQMIRGEIMHHWRREARQNGTQQFDGDWDKLMEIVEEDNTEEMIQRVTRYAYELRPRLRTIITRLYLTGKPPTAKELANEFNISEARLSQLKQEAVTLLREMMQKS